MATSTTASPAFAPPRGGAKDDLQAMRVEASGAAAAPARRWRWPSALTAPIVGVTLTVLVIGVGLAVAWHRSAPQPAASSLGLPVVSGSSLKWITIGDWGRLGGYAQRDVAEAMGRVAADVGAAFIISVGDNFYDSGVAGVDDPQFNESWRDIYTHPGLATRPWYIIAGNHDYRGGLNSLRGQIAYSGRDPRWRFPALNTTASFAFGGGAGRDVAFVYVDTCPYISKYKTNPDSPEFGAAMAAADPTAPLTWLDASLAGAADASALIVVGHHPVWSAGEHGDSPDLIAAYAPLFVRHGVDAYLAGHDHTLIHLVANGTQFVVSGGGSKIRDNTAATPETRFFADVAGFTLHSVNATHACHAYVGADAALLWHVVVELRKHTAAAAAGGAE